jgi:predicted nucleic acid-binding protein
VVNAAPIIFLAKLGHLEFLRLNAEEVLVPTEVLKEIAAKQDEATEEVSKRLGDWLKNCEVVRSDLMRFLIDMDEGERAVLA